MFGTIRVFISSLSLLSLMLVATVSAAQSHYQQLLTHVETSIQRDYRNFRLVLNVEKFPERISASEAIKVASNPQGAIVTLHDLHSGEPLESCKAPCSLSVDRGQNYIFVAYKSGYMISQIVENDQGWREFYKGNPLVLTLGSNLGVHYNKAYKCYKEWGERQKTDRDAEVCSRISATMPPAAKKSGHCYVVFDVTAEGRTENARAEDCTDPIFEKASLWAVSQWFYYPKVERGVNITQRGIRSKLIFRLTSETGELIPLNGTED